jgi:uroporphyrinogen decarboxylase
MNWKEKIFDNKKRYAIPVMTNPGIEAIGKTIKQAVTNGNVHYEALKYLSEKYNIAACTAIMDLTVEAEAFGAQVNMPEDEVPTVIGRLLADADSVEALQVPDLTQGRIPQYLLANKLAAENIKSVPVLSGCIGPFSLAGRLYDMTEIMVAIYIEPDVIAQLLEKCTQFLINYCKALKSTGTAGVIIAEPAAGLLSNDDCMAHSTEYVKKIIEAVQDENFTVILHNCGNTGQCTPAMVASGAEALHFGNKINMLDALRECPSDIIALGNLDPVGIFKQGTVAGMQSATRKLLEETAAYKNFVLSSGCDIPPHTPEENVSAFFDTLAEFNAAQYNS